MNLHSENSHIGDIIWGVAALSRVPGDHVLRCNPEYHKQLRELVEGTSIAIEDCSNIPRDSFDCWIASGRFRGIHYRDDIDIMGFVRTYFNAMMNEAGFGCVFPTRQDMLLDLPAINNAKHDFHGILVINADPKSGQCPRYSSSEMDALIRDLEDSHPSVLAIEKADLTLAQIGVLSVNAKLIIGCATGPWWPTMNRMNAGTPRVCMLDPMRLYYGDSVPIVHASCANKAREMLKVINYL